MNYELGKTLITPFGKFVIDQLRKNQSIKLEYMTPFDNRSSASYDDGHDITIATSRFNLN